MDTEQFKTRMDALRATLKGVVAEAVSIKGEVKRNGAADDTQNAKEMVANVTIAYRAVETAAMRFGKAIQAATGGVSPLGGPDTPTA